MSERISQKAKEINEELAKLPPQKLNVNPDVLTKQPLPVDKEIKTIPVSISGKPGHRAE